MMKSLFSWFRTIAFMEGISYVLLLVNMLVIKNTNPELGQQLVWPIGMAHGVLFIGYLILALLVKIQYKKSFGWLMLAGVVSIIPLGTFIMEARWRKEEQDFLAAKAS